MSRFSRPYTLSMNRLPHTAIENMDGTMHECMMYMPMYSEVISCKIGIDDDAVIEPL